MTGLIASLKSPFLTPRSRTSIHICWHSWRDSSMKGNVWER